MRRRDLRHHQVEVDDASGRLVSLPSESEQRMCAWLTLELAASDKGRGDEACVFLVVRRRPESERADAVEGETEQNAPWPIRAFHSLFSLLRRALIIDAFIGSAATHLSSVLKASMINARRNREKRE
jgi:hypothetical protein